MTRHQIKDEKECLNCMIEYLNNIARQLVDGFHTESNKIRHLRKSILGKRWTTTPLNNICTVQYKFYQLVMTLHEIIQLEREIKKASTSSKTYYWPTHHTSQGRTQI